MDKAEHAHPLATVIIHSIWGENMPKTAREWSEKRSISVKNGRIRPKKRSIAVHPIGRRGSKSEIALKNGALPFTGEIAMCCPSAVPFFATEHSRSLLSGYLCAFKSKDALNMAGKTKEMS